MTSPTEIQRKIKEYEAFLATRPGSPNAVFNYAWFLSRDGQFERAIENYRKAIRLGLPAPEEAHLNIGNICMDHLQEHERAIRHFQQARALNPRYAAVYHNLGNLAEQMGDRGKAAAYFRKCLELEPDNELALSRLADSHRFERDDDPLLNRLRIAALTSSSSDLHFSLGRALDQLGDYRLAWQHFAYANRLDEKSLPGYSTNATDRRFDEIARACPAEWLDRFRERSHAAVFICGLFRTGSTLLERILDAHPSFTAGGESDFFPRLVARALPDFPEGLDNRAPRLLEDWRAQHEAQVGRLAPNGTRLTDKRPDNFLYAGLIAAVLPSARFIVTERDWRDMAVSMFATRLGPGQNYATRIENIRHYAEAHRRLVDHWGKVLEDRLIRVSYEDLVDHPRAVVSRLLDWLGEDWDERCLAFHERPGAVKTASVWQVREPLHSRSVGRWKHYREPAGDAFAETV